MRQRRTFWYCPNKNVAKSNRHVMPSPVIKHNVWHPHSGGRNTYSLEATIMGSVPYKMGIPPVLKQKWDAILLQIGIIYLKFPQHISRYSASRANHMCCEFKCWSVYYRHVLWGTCHTVFVTRTYLIFSCYAGPWLYFDLILFEMIVLYHRVSNAKHCAYLQIETKHSVVNTGSFHSEKDQHSRILYSN